MKKNGFTLIELLVVIFIIGALAGLILPNLVSSRERARDSKRKQDLFEIRNALRLYYNDNQSYPPVADLEFGASFEDGDETYMEEVPQDQMEGQARGYCLSSDGNSFLLWSELENRADPDKEESLNRCGVSDWEADSECDLDDCLNDDDNLCYYVCGS